MRFDGAVDEDDDGGDKSESTGCEDMIARRATIVALNDRCGTRTRALREHCTSESVHWTYIAN